MKIRIYRRQFPQQGRRPSPRLLVAIFQTGMEKEANFFLDQLRRISTSFDQQATFFSDWRYEQEQDAPEIAPPSTLKDIQVDLSKAVATRRPISFALSYRSHHGKCECIAYSKKHGTVRGTVEDDPQGRRLFVNRLSAVWPNAQQES